MRADKVVMVAVRLLTFLFIGAAIGYFTEYGEWGMAMLCSAIFFAAMYTFFMLEKTMNALEVMKRNADEAILDKAADTLARYWR